MALVSAVMSEKPQNTFGVGGDAFEVDVAEQVVGVVAADGGEDAVDVGVSERFVDVGGPLVDARTGQQVDVVDEPAE